MSVLNWHVNSSSNFCISLHCHDKELPCNFHHFPLSWKITTLYFFISNILYFGQKLIIKVKIFGTFYFFSQNSSSSLCQFWNNKSVSLQIFCNSSVLFHYTFSSNIILVKSSPFKCTFFRLSSARVKFHQNPYVNFETTSQLLFKFFIILHCHCT